MLPDVDFTRIADSEHIRPCFQSVVHHQTPVISIHYVNLLRSPDNVPLFLRAVGGNKDSLKEFLDQAVPFGNAYICNMANLYERIRNTELGAVLRSAYREHLPVIREELDVPARKQGEETCWALFMKNAKATGLDFVGDMIAELWPTEYGSAAATPVEPPKADVPIQLPAPVVV